MQIELQGFDRLQAAFHQAPQLVERELNVWVHSTGLHMQREVQIRTPKRDGTLQKSISLGVEQVGKLGVNAEISTSLNYAPSVEYGAKPHDIVPKNGKALMFMMRGVPVFAKRIRHPGSKGVFMFQRAYDANLSQVQSDFGQFVDHITTKIAAGAK